MQAAAPYNSQQPLMQQPMYQQQQYGVQQAATYGATHRQGYTAAEKARMPKEERQRIETLEREDAKRARLDRMRKQQEDRSQKDANAFVIWMNLVLVLLGVLLVLSMFGDCWSNKAFTGPGFSMMKLRASLFTIEVDFHCKSSFIGERKICQSLEKYKGTFSLHEMQSSSCAAYLNPSACHVFREAYTASFPIFGCFSVACLLNLSASFCLYAYYFVSPHPRLRIWGNTFVSLAPIFATIGLVCWIATFPDLAELPHSWSSIMAAVPGIGPLLTITELQGGDGTGLLQFGWTFFAAALIVVFMYFQALAWACFFQASADEDDVLQQEQDEQAYFEALDQEQLMGTQWKAHQAPDAEPGAAWSGPGVTEQQMHGQQQGMPPQEMYGQQQGMPPQEGQKWV